jgi:NAD(P)-dependent dehydrogenase (short-subunit alcohol dehydrogenase family)
MERIFNPAKQAEGEQMPYAGLKGRVAIVTGAASGIGAATCRRLIDEQCKVAAVDIAGDALETACAALPGDTLPIVADISREEDCDRMMAQTVAQFGAVDLFVNNAGVIGKRLAITEMPVEEFDRVHAVNIRGAFLALRAALRQMQAQGKGGAVVNIASVGGLNAQPLSCAYGSSKRAIIGLSGTAAHENGPHGIRVNAVCPGAVDTPMLAPAMNRATVPEGAFKGLPLGRAANPAEVAAFIAYLLSDEASYQTGGVYTVDGGRTI